MEHQNVKDPAIGSKYPKYGTFRAAVLWSFNPFRTKRNLLYIRNQSVPRCKHFPPRFKKLASWCVKKSSLSVLRYKTLNVKRAPCRSFECWTWWYVQKPLGFKSLMWIYQAKVKLSLCMPEQALVLRRLRFPEFLGNLHMNVGNLLTLPTSRRYP